MTYTGEIRRRTQPSKEKLPYSRTTAEALVQVPDVRVQVHQGKTLRLGSARLHTFWRHNVVGVPEVGKAEGQGGRWSLVRETAVAAHVHIHGCRAVCVVLHCDT